MGHNIVADTIQIEAEVRHSRAQRRPYAQAEGLLLDVQKNRWELFNEPYEPIHLKTIKGYTFVGAHWNEHFDGKLDSFLAKHSRALKSRKPFFYVQQRAQRAWRGGRVEVDS